MLSRSFVVVMLSVAIGATSHRLEAQTATQTVRFRVLPSSQAAIEPVKTPLSIRGSTATDTRFAIGTTEPNPKLLVSLVHPMPSGVALSVALTAPAGAMTTGRVVLDTIATDLLTSIPVSAETGLPVRYTLRGDAMPVRLPAGDRVVTVTYTVVEQP